MSEKESKNASETIFMPNVKATQGCKPLSPLPCSALVGSESSKTIEKRLESPHQSCSQSQPTKQTETTLGRQDSSRKHPTRPNSLSPNNDLLVGGLAQNPQHTQNNCGSGSRENPSLNWCGQIYGNEELDSKASNHISGHVTTNLLADWDWSNSTPKKGDCWCERNPLELNSLPHDVSCTRHSKQGCKPIDCIAIQEEGPLVDSENSLPNVRGLPPAAGGEPRK